MPFIGKTPETGAFRLIDSITTSATDTYALTVQGDHYFPESARNLIVSLNGVTQAPETAYTVSGSHIVFASALTSSDVIDYILVIGDAVDIGTPSDGTVGNAQLKASLDLSGKTLTLANDQISGDVIHGGTISNFASTGIDDNATSTAITIDADENVAVGHASPVSLGAGYKNVDIRYTTGGGVTLGDTSNIHAYLFSDNNGVTLQAPNSRSIKFTTGSTTAITIDSSQQVGVGTISPDAVLHTAKTQASGDVPVILENSGTSGVSTASLVFAGSGGGGAEKARIKSAVYGDGYMAFHTNNDTEKMRLDASGNLGIAGAPQSFGAGVTTLQLKGLSSSQPTRAGALRFISNNGTSCDTAIYSDNGFMSFYTGTSTSQNLNLQIDAYGGLNIKSVAGTQAAMFGGSNVVNGITALPSPAGVPFVVGRDTGTLRSAHFAGYLKFDSGYGVDFDVSGGSGVTVSSNVLDDYEEGTFTPTHSSNNMGGTASYTKIGRSVTVVFDISIPSGSATSSFISGLPFTVRGQHGTCNIIYSSTATSITGGYVAVNNAYIAFTVDGGISATNLTGGDRIIGACHYFTD